MAQKKAIQNKKTTGNKKGSTTKKTTLKSQASASKADAVRISEKKVVKMPKEDAVHVPVKTPMNVYKGLFFVCLLIILGMLAGAAYVYTEYQLAPREAVIINVLKGEKPQEVVEDINPAAIKKGQVRKARVFSQEEMQQIIEEMRKSEELRKIKEKRAARRAQKASGSKTEIKPVEIQAQ